MMWLKRLLGLAESPQHADALDRYRALRALARTEQLEIIKALPKPALPECAKKLGLVKAGTLIINQDDEIAIAYDYCLQHFRRQGKNPIERALEADLSEESRTWLTALNEARFSAFLVESILAHRGAQVRDLIRGDELQLTDLSLASTGQAGMILIGRIVSVDELHLSSGTMIPVPPDILERLVKPVFEKFGQNSDGSTTPISASQAAALEAQVIRIALHEAGEDNSFFNDME